MKTRSMLAVTTVAATALAFAGVALSADASASSAATVRVPRRTCTVSVFNVASVNDNNILRMTTHICDGRPPCMDYDVVMTPGNVIIRMSSTCLTAPRR